MSKSKRKLKRSSPSPQPKDEFACEPAETKALSGQPPAEGERKAPQAPKRIDKAKLAKDDRVPVDVDAPHKFKRAAWRHFIRYPAAAMLTLLNVAMVMSFFERLPKQQTMDPLKELFFFGTLVFIDIFLFMPIIFEVNKAETDKDGLTLSTLFWRTRLKWEQVAKFEQPKYLKFAILLTPRCFYLLNKYHLKPFYELAEIISAKMAAQIQDRQA